MIADGATGGVLLGDDLVEDVGRLRQPVRLRQATLHGEHARALAEHPRQLTDQVAATHRIAGDVVQRFAVVDRDVALDRHRLRHVGMVGRAG